MRISCGPANVLEGRRPGARPARRTTGLRVARPPGARPRCTAHAPRASSRRRNWPLLDGADHDGNSSRACWALEEHRPLGMKTTTPLHIRLMDGEAFLLD